MNKKFFGFLLAVAALLCVSTLESCKDTNTDLYNEVLINQTEQYKDLIARINAIRQCDVDCAAVKAKLEELEAKLEELEAIIANGGDNTDLEALKNKIAELEALIADKADIADVEALKNKIAELEALIADKADIADVEALKNKIAELEALKEQLEKQAEDAAKADENLQKQIDALVEKINSSTTDEIENIITELSNLEEQYGTLNEKIQTLDIEVSNLNIEVSNLKEEVDILKEEVAKLAEKFENLAEEFDNFKSHATSIEIQAVYSNALGSLKTPVGINSSVLLAYKANLGGANHCMYWNNEMVSDDIESVEGNAGKIYLTVNPVNGNFEGRQVELVNTMGKTAGINLTPLKKADVVLQHGYTRAENTYLYETTATITSNKAGGINFDKVGFANAVKDVLSPRNGINFTDIVNLAITTANNCKTDAYMVQMEQADGNTVTSRSDIAAIAIQPLNLAQARAVSNKANELAERSFNYFERRIQSLIARLENIEIELNNIGTIDPINTSISINGGEPISVPVNIHLDSENNVVYDTELIGPDFDVQLNPEDLNISINTTFDTVDDIKNIIERMINKAENGLPYFERMKYLVSPAIFVIDGNCIRVASTDPANPTMLNNSNVRLFPSSYCLEKIVPFYRKSVKVIGGSANLYDGETNVNGKNINSTVSNVDMSVATSSTVAVSYRVLDYSGGQEDGTFYFKVK